jgi:MoaA/NifB/PqqE/SkfB family radical SAM enzyme
VLLERCADRVAEHFARLIVSLDATTAPLYEQIRGVDALAVVGRGVARLRRLAPHIPLSGRATLHRANFRELPKLIDYARTLELDRISFLPADISSGGFGREAERLPLDALTLGPDEIDEFEAIVERTIAVYAKDFASGFVAETPEKLRRLPRYYAALSGREPFPAVSCNAPWVSVVLEADGSVRPCFFHGSIGNVRRAPIGTIVARNLRAFRESLDVIRDAGTSFDLAEYRAALINPG